VKPSSQERIIESSSVQLTAAQQQISARFHHLCQVLPGCLLHELTKMLRAFLKTCLAHLLTSYCYHLAHISRLIAGRLRRKRSWPVKIHCFTISWGKLQKENLR